MKWSGAGHLVPAAVRTSLQAASLMYVGAAGLAGLGIVVGVMLSPAGEVVVNLVVEPARELVHMMVPPAVPQLLDPLARQAEPTSQSIVASTPTAAVLAGDVTSLPDENPALAAEPEFVSATQASATQAVPLAGAPGATPSPTSVEAVAGPPDTVVANDPPSALPPVDQQRESRPASAIVAAGPVGPGQTVETPGDARAPYAPTVPPAETRVPTVSLASVAHPVGDSAPAGVAPAPAVVTESSHAVPTRQPTQAPTMAAVDAPTNGPTLEPTTAPTHETGARYTPTPPTSAAPTSAPADATRAPTPVQPNAPTPPSVASGRAASTPVPPAVATPVPPVIATPVPPRVATPVRPAVATPVPPAIQAPAPLAVATPVPPRIPTPRAPVIPTPRPPTGGG